MKVEEERVKAELQIHMILMTEDGNTPTQLMIVVEMLEDIGIIADIEQFRFAVEKEDPEICKAYV